MRRKRHNFQQQDNPNIYAFNDSGYGFFKSIPGQAFHKDVMGGAIVGLILLLFFKYFLKSSLKDDFFKKESFEFTLMRQNLLFYFFMFAIPILLIALSLVSADVAGLY